MMQARILIINGPNLNMLGVREKETYGCKGLEQINQELVSLGRENRADIEFYQSNHEGELIDKIQAARRNCELIIINAGAFTHYSLAIHDALKAVNLPVIEVHMSNIYAREPFRHKSIISPVAVGGIFGFGDNSYKLALQAAFEYLRQNG